MGFKPAAAICMWVKIASLAEYADTAQITATWTIEAGDYTIPDAESDIRLLQTMIKEIDTEGGGIPNIVVQNCANR